MTRFFREPLLHFLLIGAGLFLLFNVLNDGPAGDGNNQVVVSAGRIEQLENIFTKTWQRSPTADELKGLIDDFVLEEIYYRQAVAMGIDRDDTVIRRRLRQKFEFLTDDMAAAVRPSDEDLSNYLAGNAAYFVRDTLYTFEQVYFNPDHPDIKQLMAERLVALRAGEAITGDGGMLPSIYEAATTRTVNSTFGKDFSRRLDALSAGEWQGPVESGLGLHLIRLDARVEGTLPELAEIKSSVEREWANQKRLETRQAINERLLNDYEVVIEWPAQ